MFCLVYKTRTIIDHHHGQVQQDGIIYKTTFLYNSTNYLVIAEVNWYRIKLCKCLKKMHYKK